MRNRYLTTILALGFCINSNAQLYIKNGSTLTIEGGAVVHANGDVFNDGSVSGAGFLNMLNTAQTYTGNGAINNLRISGGADVTPANSVTLGNALDVAASSSLTIPPNQYVVVNGPLTNAGTFNVDNNGSLVQTVGSTLANTGVFNVQRQGSNSATVFNYWSSPITASSVPGSNIYRWNPHTSTQDYADDAFDPGWTAFGGAMTPGVGYASTGGGLATFSGTANNAVVSQSLVYYTHNLALPVGTPFNLVGNPYPCAISAHQFVEDNPDINGSLYFWDDDLSGGSGYTTNDYATWNYTGILPGNSTPGGGGNSFGGQFAIASCQGFMVRAINPTSPVLNFNNGQRITGPNSIFFKAESEPQRLYLSLESPLSFNQILIGMVDDATDGEDRLYDAAKIRGNSLIALAAENDGKDYSIMAFAPPVVEKTIPLNVFVAESDYYTFHSNTIEGFDGYDIYLEDRSTFTYYPMVEGTQVPFQLTAGEIQGRFYLHIGSELVTSVRDAQDPAMRAWIYDGMLNVNLVNFNGRTGRLDLLDMAGRTVWSSGANVSNRFTADVSNLSRGAYLVRLVSQSGIYTERVLR